jgi:hypothetical protein
MFQYLGRTRTLMKGNVTFTGGGQKHGEAINQTLHVTGEGLLILRAAIGGLLVA